MLQTKMCWISVAANADVAVKMATHTNTHSTNRMLKKRLVFMCDSLLRCFGEDYQKIFEIW
jgi:hypothetical protein